MAGICDICKEERPTIELDNQRICDSCNTKLEKAIHKLENWKIVMQNGKLDHIAVKKDWKIQYKNGEIDHISLEKA